MNENNNNETEMDPKVVIGPGIQLRKARERQGLDQAKMAAQLHLSQAMIAALESDDFDNLPGPVFVQGYLRKYSRLLGVSEEAVIKAYQGLFPVSDESTIRGAGAQKQELSRELHSGHGVVRYVTWGILLILAVLVFFWWQSRVELEEPSSPAEEEPVEIDVQDPALDQVIPQPIPMEEEVSQPATPKDRVVEESEQVLSDIDKLLSTPDQRQSPVDDTLQQPDVVVEPEPVTSPSQVPAPSQVTAPSRVTEFVDEEAPVVSKRIVFLFREPCWTEVRDRDGKLSIYGVLGSDKQRILDSRLGPFTVLLGNAPGVELTIDGEPFDLKPFTRGKVARFTLDLDRL
jgi:cytoskeleton protein RodZ